jgi:hypothetical protein
LLTATRILNKFNWTGSKVSDCQQFDFPRIICEENVGVPDAIMQATAEIAYHLLDGWDPDLESNNLGTTAQGFAGIKETYDLDNIPFHVRMGLPSGRVADLIQPFIRDEGTVEIRRV